MREPSGVFYTDEQHDALISGHRRQIADLQGQRVKDVSECVSLTQRLEQMQQRVAQLEGERESLLACQCDGCSERLEDNDAYCQKCWTTLQADHARVLGLVQALPVAGLPVEHARSDDFVVLQANGEWMVHTYNYWAKFATEDEARAYIALLEYRASLPAQPAQGGA